MIGAHPGHPLGYQVGRQPKGAEFPSVPSPRRFYGEPPRRGDSLKGTGSLWFYSERGVGPRRHRAIPADLGVDKPVPVDIRVEADNLLRESTFDQCHGARSRRQLGSEKGVAPGRCRVPDIVHGRVVVGAHTKDSLATEQLGRGRVTEVDVVPMDPIGNVAVSHLREGAETGEDFAAIEEAARESEVVVEAKTRHEPAVYTLPDIGKSRDRHGCDRREIGRAATPSIAVELELAAVRCKFGKTVVAGGALLAGLSGIAWQCSRRRDANNADRSDRKNRHRGKCGVHLGGL